nr:hypothetical protein [Tanacetum cinerariifolium]
MLDEKPVLVDDDGKSLIKVDNMVNADSDIEVDEVSSFMASTNPYDDVDFDECGLTNAQMEFAISFDISLRSERR